MANKINNKYFGITGLDLTPHIPIRFKTDGTVIEGYILKQKGARRFKCSNDNGSVTAVAKLTNAVVPVNNGDASLVGIAAGSTPVAIRKLGGRKASDFNGRIYKWTLQDDSSETLIILTLIS
jgi:hypothetical protein